MVHETSQTNLDYYFGYYTKLQDQLENEGVSARFQLIENILGMTVKSFGNNIKNFAEPNIKLALARWPD